MAASTVLHWVTMCRIVPPVWFRQFRLYAVCIALPQQKWPLREKFSKGASVPQAARVMSARYRLLLALGTRSVSTRSSMSQVNAACLPECEGRETLFEVLPEPHGRTGC